LERKTLDLSGKSGDFAIKRQATWGMSAEAFMATVRAHWEIENALHWQLDVSFREDAARNRKDNGPANIAILRRRALDLARRDTSKGSLSIKMKRAGWSDCVSFQPSQFFRRRVSQRRLPCWISRVASLPLPSISAKFA